VELRMVSTYIWFMCGRVRLLSDYSEVKIGIKFDMEARALIENPLILLL
jgi:hypothetical protein